MTTAYQNITSGEEVDDPLTHVLVCQQCRYPLVLGCDIIVEKADVWKDQVYPYELDILELEDVWCYSATNPSGTRFDLVRGKPNNNITYDCENSSFHTFFPGFAWNHLSCKCCRHFFGFGFTKLSENPYIVASVAAVLSLLTTSCDGTLSYSSVDELEENLFPSVDFLGIILTRTIPREMPFSEIQSKWDDPHEHRQATFNPTMIFTDVVRLVRELRDVTSGINTIEDDQEIEAEIEVEIDNTTTDGVDITMEDLSGAEVDVEIEVEYEDCMEDEAMQTQEDENSP